MSTKWKRESRNSLQWHDIRLTEYSTSPLTVADYWVTFFFFFFNFSLTGRKCETNENLRFRKEGDTTICLARCVCVQFENAAISVPAVVQVIGANKSGVRFSGANKLSRRGSKNCPNIPKITVSDVTFLKRTDKVNKLVSISSFLEGSVSF